MKERVMPLLVVTKIEIRPQRVSGNLLIGGHPEQIVLDLSMPTLVVGHQQIPTGLDRHHSALKAVIALLMDKYGGKDVVLPADLSNVVRQACEPWPVRFPDSDTWSHIQRDAASIPVSVKQVQENDPLPGFVTVKLDFVGTSATVVMDLTKRSLRFRFLQGVHPWQLTPVESCALITALCNVSAVQTSGSGVR